MTSEISLRDVQESDLPIFFEQQLDPEATHLAAFPARDHDAFKAHWAKIMADDNNIVRTISFRGEVAGNIVCWEQCGECKVGYWLGRRYWGKGIASAALSQFLELVKARPLYARVAKHNAASIRILQKCGFTICGEDTFPWGDGEEGEEFILVLRANGPV
jgi:RimJ/RimL family protein N-acetyltransferase